MITITQLAKDYMASVSNGGHVTLGVKSGGCAGFEYIWGLSTDDGVEHVKWSNPIEDVLLVDPLAEMYIIGENDGGAVLQYSAGSDQAQGTAFQILASDGIENDNDTAGSGYLHLYNPSSTTFVKHFTSFFNHPHAAICIGTYVAGYFNTTSAIDEIQFKFASGNIDAGDICL